MNGTSPRASGLGLVLACLAACGGGSSAAPEAATSASLSAQTAAAATPSVSASTSDVLLSEQMLEAQLLCTTELTYEPCGLVAAGDTVNCFILCQTQISTGVLNLVERGALACAALPPEPPDAGSPACEVVIRDSSPVNPLHVRDACNARCRELQSDGGLATAETK